jgi:hypothetical protein
MRALLAHFMFAPLSSVNQAPISPGTALCISHMVYFGSSGEIWRDAAAGLQAPTKADSASGRAIAAPLVISNCGQKIDRKKRADCILCHADNSKLTIRTAIFGRKLQISDGAWNVGITTVAAEEPGSVAILRFSNAVIRCQSGIMCRPDQVL